MINNNNTTTNITTNATNKSIHNNSNNIGNKIANFLENYQKLLILGIGNSLRNDDGLGPFFADNLANSINNTKFSDKIVIINAGSVPENFTGKIKKESPSHIIIVDAVTLANNNIINNNNSNNKSNNSNSNSSNNDSSDNITHINYITNNDLINVDTTTTNTNIDNNIGNYNNNSNDSNNNVCIANDNNNNNESNSIEYMNYGDINLVSRDKISNISISSHSMSLSFLIKYLEMDISFEILIFGVVPKNMDFGNDISPEIQESLTYLEGIILNTLDL